ncbi:MAG: hypothetical protein SVK44_08445 [Nitrospirota bacterium]|nr:hypothetical protein [Nitrospirota bacterium]
MVSISIASTGLLFILFAVLIFAYPQLLAYILALGFLLLGVGLMVLGLMFRRFEKGLVQFRRW